MSRTDQSDRLIAAAPQTIYDAMTNPLALAVWLPPAGMHGEMIDFALRPGGHYKMILRHDDVTVAGKSGGNEDIAMARYVELVPGRLIVQHIDFPSADPAFAGTMVMHWILDEMPDGTLVTIRAENVPLGISAADHAEGLASSLENLARFVER
jgi:uncharacterized protein YndB with AHSA1/START domain